MNPYTTAAMANLNKQNRKLVLQGIIDWCKKLGVVPFWDPSAQLMEELRAKMNLAGYIHTRDGGKWYTKVQLQKGSSEITCTFYGLQDFVTAEYWKLSE